MRIVVVGGSGKVGSLVLPFLAETHELRVFDLRPPALTGVAYVEGSVTDPRALADAVAGTDALLYMAMGRYVRGPGDVWGSVESRADAFDVNVKGLHLALHAAHQAGVGHAVYTSSMSIYHGNCLGREGADEDTPPDADNVYGFTKRLGEEVCRNACRVWGMSVNALRLYFPVSEETWHTRVKDGEPTLSTTAEDTARALRAALEYRDGFQAFTISGDYAQQALNMAKARRLLNWEPQARPR